MGITTEIRRFMGKLGISSLLIGIGLVCLGATFRLVQFAISAPNSAVAEFAIGASLLLFAIGGFCLYCSYVIWSAP